MASGTLHILMENCVELIKHFYCDQTLSYLNSILQPTIEGCLNLYEESSGLALQLVKITMPPLKVPGVGIFKIIKKREALQKREEIP